MSSISLTSILSANAAANEPDPFLQSAYDFWFSKWSAVFKKNNATTELNSHDFFDKDIINLLSLEGHFAGHSSHRIWNIEDPGHRENSYFNKKLSREFLAHLDQRNLKRVLSFEFLLVDPRQQKKVRPLSLSKIIILTTIKIMNELSLDAIVGPVRKDIGVTDLITLFGGESLIKNVSRHNTQCDLMIIKNSGSLNTSDFALRREFQEIWENRDTINYGEQEQTKAV